ncbi:hypothetical protein VPH35_136528 [Triticum aestivum]
MRTLLPPKEKVHVYGDGNVKVIFMDEDDVATYTIKSIDDPRALNKTIYLRPPENILSQNELIAKWEKLSGEVLERIPIPSDEFLASMEDFEGRKEQDDLRRFRAICTISMKVCPLPPLSEYIHS